MLVDAHWPRAQVRCARTPDIAGRVASPPKPLIAGLFFGVLATWDFGRHIDLTSRGCAAIRLPRTSRRASFEMLTVTDVAGCRCIWASVGTAGLRGALALRRLLLVVLWRVHGALSSFSQTLGSGFGHGNSPPSLFSGTTEATALATERPTNAHRVRVTSIASRNRLLGGCAVTERACRLLLITGGGKRARTRRLHLRRQASRRAGPWDPRWVRSAHPQ